MREPDWGESPSPAAPRLPPPPSPANAKVARRTNATVSGSTISGNGKDGQQYNGDGVGLNGTGGSVTDDSISDNGDGIGFEHGVYAGPTASGYLIARNVIAKNAGADIKAAGGPGLVADNQL